MFMENINILHLILHIIKIQYMKHIYLITVFAFISTLAFSQDIIIGFGLNQYSISKYSDSVLSSKLPEFQSSDSIIIIGHTDTVGTTGFNAALSRNRAESIK